MAYKIRVLTLNQQMRQLEAIHTCLDVLDTLNVRLPRRNLKFHVMGSIAWTLRRIRTYSDEALLQFSNCAAVIILIYYAVKIVMILNFPEVQLK